MAIDDLLSGYADRAGTRGAAGVPSPPKLGTAIVTCMDSRIDTHTLFGLELGDSHVLRNAGGVVTDDIIRSLAISQRKLGTRSILLMQHAQCGMMTFADDDFTEELADEVGMRPSWRPLAFKDVAVSVRRDLHRLRHDPFLLPGTVIRGFVLELDDLSLHEVQATADDADAAADAVA